MATARFRISSKSSKKYGIKTYIGKVHVYEPWVNPARHDSLYKRFLFSKTTDIHRLTANDAQYDAKILGYELTGEGKADNDK